jgi:hypothetical protein
MSSTSSSSSAPSSSLPEEWSSRTQARSQSVSPR